MNSNEQGYKPKLEEILTEPGIDKAKVLMFIADSSAPQSGEAADLLLQMLQDELEMARGTAFYELQVRTDIAKVALVRFNHHYFQRLFHSTDYNASQEFAFAELALLNLIEVGKFNDIYTLTQKAGNSEITEKALSFLQAKKEAFVMQKTSGRLMGYTEVVSELEALLHEQRGNYEAAAITHFQAGHLREAYVLSRRQGVSPEVKWRIGQAYLADLEGQDSIEAALSVAKEIGDDGTAATLARELRGKKRDQSLETMAKIENLKSELANETTPILMKMALIKTAVDLRTSLSNEQFTGQLSLIIFDAHLSLGNYPKAWENAAWVLHHDRQHYLDKVEWLRKLIAYTPKAFGFEEGVLYNNLQASS